MTKIVDLMIAYYAAGPAKDLNIATRWYPHGELILIVEDKFSIASRKFGSKVRSHSKEAATAFLDIMIAKGGWETKSNEYGGQMHQFQSDKFHTGLNELTANDAVIAPIVSAAASEGPEYWENAFGELVG